MVWYWLYNLLSKECVFVQDCSATCRMVYNSQVLLSKYRPMFDTCLTFMYQSLTKRGVSAMLVRYHQWVVCVCRWYWLCPSDNRTKIITLINHSEILIARWQYQLHKYSLRVCFPYCFIGISTALWRQPFNDGRKRAILYMKGFPLVI